MVRWESKRVSEGLLNLERLDFLQTLVRRGVLYANTGSSVIMKCRQGFHALTTYLTVIGVFRCHQRCLDFGGAVLPDEMYKKIRLRECPLKGTAMNATLHEFLGLLTVLCPFVEIQRRGVEKSLLTEITLERKPRLVRLQMIVHRILLLLCHVTVRAHVESSRIFSICVGHRLDRVDGGDGFNFFGLGLRIDC